MQEIRAEGLDKIAEAFEALPDAMKEAKAEIFDDIGKDMLSRVQRRIGGSGKIAGAQTYAVGSGKGYVAVRAKANTRIGKYAAGYVTNALESGHIAHTRKGLRFVSGKHMYQDSAGDADAAAERAVAQLEAKAVAVLEGRA